ncbi:unnamed protein product [Cunninghamella echinulata]
MQKQLPTEILQEIIQYSDTLIRIILGFSIDKGKILQEGGPGKVLDEFLRRNGNLEYLKEWIPGECALMHGILTKDPKKVLKIDRIWCTNMFSNQGYELSVTTKFIWGTMGQMEKPINIYKCHAKYLVDAPKDYLDKNGKIMIALYKKKKINVKSRTICDYCIKYNMYKEAICVAPDNYNIAHELYKARYIDSLMYLKVLGIICETEYRAYEICMNPEDDELIDVLDDNDNEDMKIYDIAMEMSMGPMESRLPEVYWNRDIGSRYIEDIGCTDTTWER